MTDLTDARTGFELLTHFHIPLRSILLRNNDRQGVTISLYLTFPRVIFLVGNRELEVGSTYNFLRPSLSNRLLPKTNERVGNKIVHEAFFT